MITNKDPRVATVSKKENALREYADGIIAEIYLHKGSLSEYSYGTERLKVDKVMKFVDQRLMNYRMEIDGRTLTHAHNIGNNNEWSVVDEDLIEVGKFYCNDDMFGGVYVGFIINGEIIAKDKIR